MNWTNITTPGELLAVPNANTSGAFWTVILYMIWIVLTIVFMPFNVEVAFLASTFIIMVMSIFLVYMELIAWQNALFFIGFLIFEILYIIWSSTKDQ